MVQKKKIGPHTELSVFLTFFALIALGAALLSLPLIRYQGGISLLDTVFMATSAVCVTGLVTVPTSGFNLAGQLVLLALIQLGAIGIMTVGSSLILLFRGELSLPQRLLAANVTESYPLREVEGVLRMVIKYTFFAEIIGLVVLTIGFSLEGYGVGDSLYYGLFHTISAFCNAGFSPFDESLVGMNWLVKTSIMLLIIMGGLGYYVVFELASCMRQQRRLSIHTRTVLLGTVILIVVGMLLALVFESFNIGWLDAVFQSVTARTAGFNTVDLTNLHTATISVLMILMIIGAAPGSTGGGVKITTFMAALFSVYNIFIGRVRVVVFGRKLPRDQVLRAYALIMLYSAFLTMGTILLLYTESASFLATLFEMISAVGTVGLSLGLTPDLSAAGKVIVIIGMFGGRIGPAVLVLTFLRGERITRIDYPEEKIILG
jgi:trk system potassium uptake protein